MVVSRSTWEMVAEGIWEAAAVFQQQDLCKTPHLAEEAVG